MKKQKDKTLYGGVIVRFEEIDDEDNVINVLAEKAFPNAEFGISYSGLSCSKKYHCWDKEVNDYVYSQHIEFDVKFNYANWEEAPNIRQAFYNKDGDLMYTEDEVEYEMNL